MWRRARAARHAWGEAGSLDIGDQQHSVRSYGRGGRTAARKRREGGGGQKARREGPGMKRRSEGPGDPRRDPGRRDRVLPEAREIAQKRGRERPRREERKKRQECYRGSVDQRIQSRAEGWGAGAIRGAQGGRARGEDRERRTWRGGTSKTEEEGGRESSTQGGQGGRSGGKKGHWGKTRQCKVRINRKVKEMGLFTVVKTKRHDREENGTYRDMDGINSVTYLTSKSVIRSDVSFLAHNRDTPAENRLEGPDSGVDHVKQTLSLFEKFRGPHRYAVSSLMDTAYWLSEQ
ncbi:hypothetical protein Tco_1264525 [Tanacetum coccineum]